MKLFSVSLAVSLFCASFVSLNAAPTAEEVIAKVRAKLGDEKAMSSVKTITFEAKLLDAENNNLGLIMIQYKAPDKRREYILRTVEVAGTGEGENASKKTSIQIERILATDGLEGFEKQTNLETRESRLVALPGQQISILKDYAVADLGFYSVPKGGKVAFAGEEKKAGKDCYVLEYTFTGGSKFRRYFDKAAFQPVAQAILAEDGTVGNYVTDEGEIVEKGIKFPKKNIQFNKDGKKESTVEFTTISVNEDIPDSVFAFPMP